MSGSEIKYTRMSESQRGGERVGRKRDRERERERERWIRERERDEETAR